MDLWKPWAKDVWAVKAYKIKFSKATEFFRIFSIWGASNQSVLFLRLASNQGRSNTLPFHAGYLGANTRTPGLDPTTRSIPICCVDCYYSKTHSSHNMISRKNFNSVVGETHTLSYYTADSLWICTEDDENGCTYYSELLGIYFSMTYSPVKVWSSCQSTDNQSLYDSLPQHWWSTCIPSSVICVQW